MAQIHYPPREILLYPDEKLYYLAGTSLRSASWELDASHILEKNLRHVGTHIAEPRNRTSAEYYASPLFQEWEERGLELATHYGGILLWIAADETINPSVYAGKIRTVYDNISDLYDQYPAVRLSIGVDTNSQVTHDFLEEMECNSRIPIFDDLTDTCFELLDKVRA